MDFIKKELKSNIFKWVDNLDIVDPNIYKNIMSVDNDIEDIIDKIEKDLMSFYCSSNKSNIILYKNKKNNYEVLKEFKKILIENNYENIFISFDIFEKLIYECSLTNEILYNLSNADLLLFLERRIKNSMRFSDIKLKHIYTNIKNKSSLIYLFNDPINISFISCNNKNEDNFVIEIEENKKNIYFNFVFQ
jgi:hypothetical protein